MKHLNKSRKKNFSQNRQGNTEVITWKYRTLTPLEFKLVSPQIFPVQNKGKSPPYWSRSPGKSHQRLKKERNPSHRKKLIINNKEEFSNQLLSIFIPITIQILQS